MDTQGHHEISEVGRELIDNALRRAGKRGWRTNAFYFGNWITDVQQGVDPHGYDDLAEGLEDGVDRIARSLANFRGPQWQQWLRDQATPYIEQFRNKGVAVANAFRGGQSSRAAQTLKDAFRIKAYFKFVHPHGSSRRTRMDYRAFRHIYDNGFGQYFPHEHLDRFPQSTTDTESSTVTPNGHGRGSDPLSPHMYSYLRDDIQICAGLIAELDRDWARRTLSSTGEAWEHGDRNRDWNFKLAQLGHALHAIEDFFAHTNFVEHGLQASGYRMPSGHAGEIIQKRLKRMSGTARDNDSRWTTLHPEPEVVTGYFDGWDTLHSLSHVVEELGYALVEHFSRTPSAPDSHSREHEIGKLVVRIVREMQGQNVNRQAAEAILRRLAAQGNDDVDQAIRDAADAVLNHLPREAREIKNELLDLTVALSRRIPSSTLTFLDALLFIHGFYENLMYPSRLLRWILVELPPDALRWVVEHTAGAVVDAIREPLDRAVRRVVEEQLNRFRVGCHSLLAKDYAWAHEPEINRTYQLAKQSAKAVHWYVIKSLVRHAEPARVPVSRADTDQDNANQIARREWIDWLELVETFLRHPAGTRSSPVNPPVADRWWHPVFQRKDYERMPGYNDTDVGREPDLPHQFVFITRAALDDQVSTAAQKRSDASSAYNR